MSAMPFALRTTDTPTQSFAERHILETMHNFPDYNGNIKEGLRALGGAKNTIHHIC